MSRGFRSAIQNFRRDCNTWATKVVEIHLQTLLLSSPYKAHLRIAQWHVAVEIQ